MNILIGDVSSYKAMVVAKFIHYNYPNIKIYSFDSRNFTGKIHSKYVYKHIVIDSYNIDSFTDIILKEKIDYFIPVNNEQLKDLWKNKNKFGSTLDYLGNYEDFTVLNDKILLHNLAKKLQVKVPEKYRNIQEAKSPFVIKPTNLSSAKGVIYINDKDQIPKDYSFKEVIIQQFVQGIGVGYSFYCKNGKILNGYGHKRLAEFPVSGGSSTYRSYYKDDRMIEIAARIVGHINYSGFAMFEFKLTASNELYLLEVNPRIWGSINQGLVNGVNYFESIFGVTKARVIDNKRQINSYVSPHIYITLLLYLLKFNIKPLKMFIENIFYNKPDVSMFNDPKGYLSSILRKINI